MEHGTELTPELLRTELRARFAEQTLSIKEDMDERLAPIHAHISRVDRGELTIGQRAAILDVVDGRKDARLTRRSMKAPLWSLVFAAISLVTTVLLTLAATGFNVG